MEQLNTTTIEINNDTSKILDKLNQIYGLENYKETIKVYDQYLKLKKENLINIGNLNVLIQVEAEYAETQKLIDIIYKLLKINKIISTKYIEMDSSEILKNKNVKPMKEELIVVYLENRFSRDKEEILEIIQKNYNKIFIIIEKSENNWTLRKWSSKFITWYIKIEEPTVEEKNNYIQNILKNNHVKVEKKCDYIEKLSRKPFSKINDELVDIIIKCKSNKIGLITENLLKELDKKEYLKEGGKQEKNKRKAIEELDSLIGLEDVKNQIKQIVNYIKINKSRGIRPSLHMVFEGNPGTGKTEVSRIIGKIFSEEKILSGINVFVEAERADLIGRYIGHTASMTKEKIEEALGGVLFIDEAYALNPRGSDKDFGAECIATLLKGMEDNREDLCVILAGYTKEMEELLKVNSGFESRIQFKIKFPDYSSTELFEIFKKMAKDQNYKLSNDIRELLIQYFECESKKDNFSNARCVRNLFEKIKFEQAERVGYNEKEDVDLIKRCDIEKVLKKLDVHEEVVKRKIGFAI